MDSLPKAAQPIAQGDVLVGNGDNYLSPDEAAKQIQSLREKLTDMSGSSLWTRVFPGKEIASRTRTLEAAIASYQGVFERRRPSGRESNDEPH